MRYVLRLALLFAVLPAAGSAQRTDDEWLRSCERNDDRLVSFCDVRVQSLGALGAVHVDASPNGGVQIVAWDRSDVEVHSRVQARARTDGEARALADQIDIRIDGESIASDGPESRRNASWSVSFVVFVPARVDVTAETVNGPMSVAGVTGRMDVRTVNGPLSLHDVAGDVQAKTQNGPLSIRLAGSRWNGEGLDAETSNGPLTLEIPDGYNAQLETGSVNGPMVSDVPLTVRFDGRRSRRIQATLGDGGPPVRAVTTNGPVTIRAR